MKLYAPHHKSIDVKAIQEKKVSQKGEGKQSFELNILIQIWLTFDFI